MDEHKAPLSIRLIYALTQFMFWITIIAGIFVVVIGVASFLGSDFDGYNTELELPVKMDLVESGVMHLGDEAIQVGVVDATGTFTFEKMPPTVGRYVFILLLGLLALALAGLWFFRKFITNVKRGHYFREDNIKLLRKIAYCILAIWAFIAVTSAVFSGFLISTVSFDSVRFSGVSMDSSGVLLFALFLWVLSHIFSTGVKLQQDQELTI